MGKLHKTIRKFTGKYDPGRRTVGKIIGKKAEAKIWEGSHFLGKSAENAYDAKQDAKQAAKDAANEPVMPLADEDELQRAKRRQLSRRGGGRASTILGGGDSETLG